MKTIKELQEKLAEEIKKVDRSRKLTADAARILWLDYGTSQDWLRLAQPWTIENESISKRVCSQILPFSFSDIDKLVIGAANICNDKPEPVKPEQGKTYKTATLYALLSEPGVVHLSVHDKDSKKLAEVSANIESKGEARLALSLPQGFSSVRVKLPCFAIFNTTAED